MQGPWRREVSPPLSERAYTIPEKDAIPYGVIYYVHKGHFLGLGATAFVDRLLSGHVVKYPHPNRYCLHEEEKNRDELKIEARVYHRIGTHPRIHTLIEWDEDSCSLALEYLKNANLLSYMEAHADSVTDRQRHAWMVHVAKELAAMHAADVIHCDFAPQNLLLDGALQLHVADFAGSSISGSQCTRTTTPRFQPPGWSCKVEPRVRDDIFALGSVMCFISTGLEPYHDLPEEEVVTLFIEADFPDVSTLGRGDVIRRC